MTSSSATAPVRPVHLLLLVLALLAGGYCRFYRISDRSLSLDEYFSVYRATGRDNSIFYLPHDVLMAPPPVTMRGAEPWWHIWPNIAGYDSHPPVYYILLRWWMDLFGESDLSTRAFSALTSLAGAVVLFDVCRRWHGPWIAVAAATMMALSPMQIDWSQETRSYPLLLLLLLVCADALAAISTRGVSRTRLAVLTGFTAASLLTHYFTSFALLGMGLYVLLQWKGESRRKTVVAMGIGLAIMVLSWGPFLPRERNQIDPAWLMSDRPGSWFRLLRQVVDLPVYHLNRLGGDFLAVGIAVLVYVLPPLAARRKPLLLFWWLWLVVPVSIMLFMDLARQTQVLLTPRYTFLVAAPIFVLAIATVTIRPWSKLLAGLIVASVVIGGTAMLVDGPRDKPDWRLYAQTLDRMAGPQDAIAYYPDNALYYEPAHWYLGVQRYTPDSKRPILILDNAIDRNLQKNIAGQNVIWLVGAQAIGDGQKFFPGWKIGRTFGLFNVGTFAELIRPQNPSTLTSPASPPGK